MGLEDFLDKTVSFDTILKKVRLLLYFCSGL